MKSVENTQSEDVGKRLVESVIKSASNEALAMSYALGSIALLDKKIARRLLDVIWAQIGPIYENPHHLGMDYEGEISPVVEWINFLEGFKTAGWYEAGQSRDITASAEIPARDENLTIMEKVTAGKIDVFRVVVKFASRLTYREKLLITLTWQLLSKESEYHNKRLYNGWLGNDILKDCKAAVAAAAAANNTDYLQQADPTEAMVTGFTAALLPLDV